MDLMRTSILSSFKPTASVESPPIRKLPLDDPSDYAGTNELLRFGTDSVAMPAGAEAHVDFGAFAARLKSCPVTKHEFFRQ